MNPTHATLLFVLIQLFLSTLGEKILVSLTETL